MIIVMGYNVVRNGVAAERIRFSEFSRPWIGTYEKLSEYRLSLISRHQKDTPDKVAIDLIHVEPGPTDKKFLAIQEFLNGTTSRIADIAKNYEIKTTELRKLIAEYAERSAQIKKDIGYNNGEYLEEK